MTVLGLDRILNTVFHKDQFWVHYFFNVNIIDLFYECVENDIANYADNTTPYSCGSDILTVIPQLKDISTKVSNWFGNNHYMK